MSSKFFSNILTSKTKADKGKTRNNKGRNVANQVIKKAGRSK